MTHSELTRKIQILMALHQSYEALTSPLELTPESPLNTTFYELLQQATSHLEELAGSQEKWLDWFWWENDCGTKAREAGYDGNMQPVTSAADIATLIITASQRP